MEHDIVSASTKGSVAETLLDVVEQSPDQEIFLAALGNKLAKLYGRTLADLLAERRLADYIKSELGDQIGLYGSKNRLIARKFTAEPEQRSLGITTDQSVSTAPLMENVRVPRKYHPRFWSAFITPPKRNHWRAIDPRPPFAWTDGISGSIPPGWLTIEVSQIPSKDQAWPQRKRAVATAIEVWCKANHLDFSDFVERAVELDGTEKSRSGPIREGGAVALLELLRCIPPSKRQAEFLSASLIFSLLSSEEG